jgi:hypothetical protein
MDEERNLTEENNLDDRNTLVMLSQFNTANQKQLISGFVELQKSIATLPSPNEQPLSLPMNDVVEYEKEETDGKDM